MEAELKRQRELQVKWTGILGHRYVGFDGESPHHGRYSMSETDNRKRVLQECKAVYDHRTKKWIKE